MRNRFNKIVAVDREEYERLKAHVCSNKVIKQESDKAYKSLISAIRREIEFLTPRLFAVHLDTYEGKKIQADYEQGFYDLQKRILVFLTPLNNNK